MKCNNSITKQQQAILDLWNDSSLFRRPSLRTIQKKMGFSSVTSIVNALQALEKKGFISKEKHD